MPNASLYSPVADLIFKLFSSPIFYFYNLPPNRSRNNQNAARIEYETYNDYKFITIYYIYTVTNRYASIVPSQF